MGFPHSEIFGSKCAGNSPKLIAACHVLHRLSVPRHPPNALVVLDLTFCQRNDDLAIVVSARSVQGTTPARNGLDLPIPTTLPRRQSAELDFQTSSSDKRCQRTNATLDAARKLHAARSDARGMMVEADGIEPTTSCLQSRRSPN
jgi:hypothetical protein